MANNQQPRPLSRTQLQAILARIPFNSTLGMRVSKVHRDGITIECPLRREFRNAAGVLHGGVTASLADVAVGMALARQFRGRRPATTVELKLNYLRPIDGRKVFARSRLLRVGSNLAVGLVDLWGADKKLSGVALVTYMFLNGP